MKELDRTKAYDLRDLNDEKRKELLNYMRSNFEKWRKTNLIFVDSILIYRDDRWWQGCVEQAENLEVINALTLFEPEVNIINKKSTDKVLPKMTEETTTDKIVLSVMNDLNERSKVGIKKYGVTLEREDVDLLGWLSHLREELMDAILYIKRAEIEIKKRK